MANISELDKKNKYLAFAGIGIPMNFYTMLINNGINIVKFLPYPDHFKYDYRDIEEITNIAKNINAKIITTEKDYSRLKIYNLLHKNNIQFVKVELKIKNEDKLINFIKSNI